MNIQASPSHGDSLQATSHIVSDWVLETSGQESSGDVLANFQLTRAPRCYDLITMLPNRLDIHYSENIRLS